MKTAVRRSDKGTPDERLSLEISWFASAFVTLHPYLRRRRRGETRRRKRRTPLRGASGGVAASPSLRSPHVPLSRSDRVAPLRGSRLRRVVERSDKGGNVTREAVNLALETLR